MSIFIPVAFTLAILWGGVYLLAIGMLRGLGGNQTPPLADRVMIGIPCFMMWALAVAIIVS